MKYAIKRALSKDGGSFIKIRNELGQIDITTIGAGLLRIAIFAGIWYLLTLAGIEPLEFFDFISGSE